MKLEQFKDHLKDMDTLKFELPNGELVPSHFHVTEVGKIRKDFIDCGGVTRHEEVVNFQLWNANDYDHRLHPEKLLSIINLSQEKLGITDQTIEVEYQGETIGKFGLDLVKGNFVLVTKNTDCLARDKCEVPMEKLKVSLSSIGKASCDSSSGCC